MEVAFSPLKKTRVAIVGMGLMGGSLALALHGKCKWVLGVDHDANTLRYARKKGMLDYSEVVPGSRFAEADIIVLALPVGAILKTLEELPAQHPAPAMVLDVGSTKVEICKAMAALPTQFDPIGGHPMCGKEHLSIYHAEAALYQGATFALTQLDRTSTAGLQLALKLVAAAGATELLIDPEKHDQWVAATSHFPYLLSSMLAANTSPELKPLVGSGWRSTTRLAATPPSMMLDVLATNRENVLQALRQYREVMGEFERVLENGTVEELGDLLNETREKHGEF